MRRLPKIAVKVAMNTEDSTINIYAMVDPRTSTVKYIGESRDIAKRYERHICETKVLRSWVSELKKLKLQPDLYILESTTQEKSRQKEQYWIERFGLSNLLNIKERIIARQFPDETATERPHRDEPIDPSIQSEASDQCAGGENTARSPGLTGASFFLLNKSPIHGSSL